MLKTPRGGAHALEAEVNQIQELCARLAERGVDHTIAGHGSGYVKWQANRTEFMAFAHDDALSVCQLGSVRLSPEQAIAATLGPGTCHKVRVHMPIEDEMHCSECGRFLGFAGDVGAPPYNFCPNCGAKVASE